MVIRLLLVKESHEEVARKQEAVYNNLPQIFELAGGGRLVHTHGNRAGEVMGNIADHKDDLILACYPARVRLSYAGVKVVLPAWNGELNTHYIPLDKEEYTAIFIAGGYNDDELMDQAPYIDAWMLENGVSFKLPQ